MILDRRIEQIATVPRSVEADCDVSMGDEAARLSHDRSNADPAYLKGFAVVASGWLAFYVILAVNQLVTAVD
jgi:hypothetical protein